MSKTTSETNSETDSETASGAVPQPLPASGLGDPASFGELDDHRQRDAASFRMLGFFFAVLGALVLVGTFWSLDNMRAIIVNVASGGVLVAVGVGMWVLSRRNRSQQTDNSP